MLSLLYNTTLLHKAARICFLGFSVVAGSIAAQAQLEVTSGGDVGIGTTVPLDRLQVNSIRPVIIGYNGGSGIYGSHIGFNVLPNTQVVPNTITKLGGTSQHGGALVTVDYYGNYNLQTYDAGTENASTINYAPQFSFTNSGRLGIGTSSPSYPLQVNGTVRATSFISDTTTYSDFVFAPDYKLPKLDEVEAHIAAEGHLPDIPSEKEATTNGIDLAAMQVKLLQKVEELTLYAIEQNKRLSAQEERIEILTQQLEDGNIR